jgi:GntR family transcriptional regulator, transcriptional repressor for pyruvate dehydrogenase complex
MLRRVNRLSISDAVYQQLSDAILAGQFQPGQALPGERTLAETLGVNRGAIREALKRLEQARLVSIQQGDGTRVLDFRKSARLDLLNRLIQKPDGRLDPDVVRSFIELREVISSDIARLAALRRSSEQVHDLEALLVEGAQLDPESIHFHHWAERFWTLLVEATRNVAYQLIENTMREVHMEQVSAMRPMIDAEFRNMERYREIARHVIDGNAAGAESAARIRAQRISRSLLTTTSWANEKPIAASPAPEPLAPLQARPHA